LDCSSSSGHGVENRKQSRGGFLGLLRSVAVARTDSLNLRPLVVKWLKPLMRLYGRLGVIQIAIDLDDHNVAIFDDNEVRLQTCILLTATDEHGKGREGYAEPLQCAVEMYLGLRSEEQPVALERRDVIASDTPLIRYTLTGKPASGLDAPRRTADTLRRNQSFINAVSRKPTKGLTTNCC